MKTVKVNELEVVETNFEVINLDSLQELHGGGCIFFNKYKQRPNSNYCSNYCNNTCAPAGSGAGPNTRRY